MKPSMKKWLAAALIAAGTVTAIPSVALARGPGSDCGPMGDGAMGGPMMRGQRMDPKEFQARMDKRTEEFKKKLAITAEQEPAWQAYAGELKARAGNMDRMREAFDAKSAPERHAKHLALEKDRLAAMERMGPVLQKLYDSLTPQQRETFDQGMHPRGHRHGGPGGPGPGGPGGPAPRSGT